MTFSHRLFQHDTWCARSASNPPQTPLCPAPAPGLFLGDECSVAGWARVFVESQNVQVPQNNGINQNQPNDQNNESTKMMETSTPKFRKYD